MQDLWISKSGLRRKGTSVLELRKLFEDGITVLSIYEPIQACSIGDHANDIKEKMRQLDFDVIGIKSTEDGPVEGYIRASDLQEGLCGDFKLDFLVADLISDSTPLIDLLTVLRDKERIFILAGNTVHGIITRADLQKPPIRILIFGLITLLDMHLSRLVRKFYPGESWRDKLSQGRIEKAEQMMKAREDRNEKLDIIDCLQFCDKRTLILAKKEILNIFGFSSEDEGKDTLKLIESLRDKLAHSQDIVTGSIWKDISTIVERMEQLIQQSEKSIESSVN